MSKVQRCAVFSPEAAILFIGTHQQAIAFLTQIKLRIAVRNGRQATTGLYDLRNIFSNEVLMLHRYQWQLKPGQSTDFTTPQTGSVDQYFGVNGAGGRDDIPRAIGALVGLDYWCETMYFGTVVSGALGVSVGDT